MLVGFSSTTIGVVQYLVFFALPLPANLLHAPKWLPSIWLWFTIALGFLAYAQFHMWKDEHDSLEKEQEDRKKDQEGHRVEVDGLKRDISLQQSLNVERDERHRLELRHELQVVSGLQLQVAELTATIGRPYVTLTFDEPHYDPTFVPSEQQTELIATCENQDAFMVFIMPVKIGDLSLQSRFETPKIGAGKPPVRMTYSLCETNNTVNGLPVGRPALVGFLKKLLQQELKATGEECLRLPIQLKYLDVRGAIWDTSMEIYYHPGFSEMPVIQLLPTQPKQSGVAITQQFLGSTTREN